VEQNFVLEVDLLNPGVISLWGIAGVGKSALVRNIYEHVHHKKSWVDVPHPFRLMEFSRRLLLGFYSKDLHAQETAAVGIMEGQDTIQACCHFLQQYVCTIVIDGLRSTHDLDSIKAVFLSEPTQSSRITVITTEETVATHCALDKRRVHNIKGLDAKDALRLFKEVRAIKVYTQPYGIRKFLC
jgi:ABC-type Mn2+/Zn2+ transport system ATPase subunit